MRYYEDKVLEAEIERIEKERENLKLKESLLKLEAQLKVEGKKNKIKFEGRDSV